MKHTAIAEALDRAGFDRASFDLRAVAANFIKTGGTLTAWNQAYYAAAGMLDGDLGPIAREGQSTSVSVQQQNASEEASCSSSKRTGAITPPTRNPMPDEDHCIGAQQGRGFSAPIRQPDRSEGQSIGVRQDLQSPAPTPTPIASGEATRIASERTKNKLPSAREPTSGFIRATIAANQAAARSVLYTVKTSDGRWWADVSPYEVTAMQRDAIRGMALLSACGALNEKQTRMTFAELLTPERAKLAFDQAQAELTHVG